MCKIRSTHDEIGSKIKKFSDSHLNKETNMHEIWSLNWVITKNCVLYRWESSDRVWILLACLTHFRASGIAGGGPSAPFPWSWLQLLSNNCYDRFSFLQAVFFFFFFLVLIIQRGSIVPKCTWSTIYCLCKKNQTSPTLVGRNLTLLQQRADFFILG
jgi:hypothetical protein